MAETRWESVGPFKKYMLVIDGWQVPLIQARELDGGKVFVTLDGRIGLQLASMEEANRVLPFIANVIGACWGYGAHPRSDEWYAEADLENPFDDPGVFAYVPHPTLAPHRVKEIIGLGEPPSEEG